MKIKIIEPGYVNFNGYFGSTLFEDSVSVDDVSTADAQRLAALVQIENMETGKNPSMAQVILDTYHQPLTVETPAAPPMDAAAAPAAAYTREQLEGTADADGIKGLRAIADPLGLKGSSVSDLINKIMAVAGVKEVPSPDAFGEAEGDAVLAEPAAQAVAEATEGTPAQPEETVKPEDGAAAE